MTSCSEYNMNTFCNLILCKYIYPNDDLGRLYFSCLIYWYNINKFKYVLQEKEIILYQSKIKCSQVFLKLLPRGFVVSKFEDNPFRKKFMINVTVFGWEWQKQWQQRSNFSNSSFFFKCCAKKR